MSEEEAAKVRDYLSRIEATKYAASPDSRYPEIWFTADPVRASSGASEFRCPDGFEVFSADPGYMPLAWDGMDANGVQEIGRWFRELPRDHKEF